MSPSPTDQPTDARVRRLVPGHPEWPTENLRCLTPDHELRTSERGPEDADPGRPESLWVKGRQQLDKATEQAIAIVGTHTVTPYGAHVAADLAYGLAGRGWTVVTTGAFGIDAAALRGALAAGGIAVAVLSSGLHRPYPSAHTQLFDRVA